MQPFQTLYKEGTLLSRERLTEGMTRFFLHEGKIAQTDDPNILKMVMRTATMDRERPLNPPLAYYINQ